MKKILLITLAFLLSFGAASDLSAQTAKLRNSVNKNRKHRKFKHRRHLAQNIVKKSPVKENPVKENPVSPDDSATPPRSVAAEEVPPVAAANSTQPIAADETPAEVAAETPPQRNEKFADGTPGGSMVVDVSANANTLIRIGLADRAVALVDFPANDPVYKIHPGNENFVTVGCFGREPNGKCLNSATDAIVLRPGRDFHALGSADAAATVITIQRVSGIVVTLLVFPVKRISENTNYVAVRYQLDEVLKARRGFGLAVNLNNAPAIDNPGSDAVITDNTEVLNASFTPVSSSEPTAENRSEAGDDPETLQKVLVEEIQRAARENPLLKFSKPAYGLSLARASGYSSRVKDITVEVIAVRNTLSDSIRLVPDQPTLAIENKDSGQTSINIEPVSLLYTATTVEDSEVLEPGRIYYFAFAYRSPILGVKQSLRVNFAQREAADAPASLALSGGNR